MSNVRVPNRSVPGTIVVARFRPTRPVLWLVAGLATMAALGYGLTTAKADGALLATLTVVWVVVVGFVLLRWVLPRLTRMSRSGWAAFAVDPHGVYLGALPRKAPVFVPWQQVAAVVLREWRVGEENARRRAVGVVVRAPGMPVDRLSPADLDRQVSVLLPMKDWHLDEQSLRSAVGSVAPGVPAFRYARG